MESAATAKTLPELRAAWEALRAEEPALRMRDAAHKLRCTEAELTASGAGFESVGRLPLDSLRDWLGELCAQGSWMWLMRTEGAVLEVETSARLNEGEGNCLFVEAEGLEVCLHPDRLAHAFYVTPQKGPARGVLIFDPSGEAVVKIYLKAESRVEQADALLQPRCESMPERLDIQPGGRAGHTGVSGKPVAPTVYRDLLEGARDEKQAVRLSVTNGGGWMRAETVPGRLEPMRDWFNILDRGFNLHLREDLLHSANVLTEGEDRVVRFCGRSGTVLLTFSVPAEGPLAHRIS